MYQVLLNNGNGDIVIHDGNTIRNNIKLLSCNLVDELNKISNLSFNVHYSHPNFNDFVELHTKISVFNTRKNEYVFKGRVLNISTSMDADGSITKSVVCESRLAYLNDSIQPYTPERQYAGDINTSGLQEFITTLLTNHNAQVEDYKKIYVGNITLQTWKTSDGVYKGLNYETTWKAIQEKLLNVFGVEIRLREENNTLYLDYAESFGTTRNTKIELGRNLKSVQQDFDVTRIITRLIPLGAKQTDEEGNETEERLTIADVNDGCIYVEDETALARYGAIYATVEWDDVTINTNLLSKARDYLIENNNVHVNNSVTALNLYLLGLDVDDINLGDSYPTKNSLLNIDETMRVVKTNINILSPQESTFDMGESIRMMSDILLDMNKQVNQTVNDVNVSTTTIKNELAHVYSTVETSMSSITSTENEIQLKVEQQQTTIDNMETFNNFVSNILSMDADGTSMIFSQINDTLTELDGKIDTTRTSMEEYIRFENGNILLGKSDNPFILKIMNDRIQFLKNGVVVSYWDMNEENFYIGNIKVDVKQKAQFGQFYFEPQENGSLSFN